MGASKLAAYTDIGLGTRWDPGWERMGTGMLAGLLPR